MFLQCSDVYMTFQRVLLLSSFTDQPSRSDVADLEQFNQSGLSVCHTLAALFYGIVVLLFPWWVFLTVVPFFSNTNAPAMLKIFSGVSGWPWVVAYAAWNFFYLYCTYIALKNYELFLLSRSASVLGGLQETEYSMRVRLMFRSIVLRAVGHSLVSVTAAVFGPLGGHQYVLPKSLILMTSLHVFFTWPSVPA
jgi:hypothetical protein